MGDGRIVIGRGLDDNIESETVVVGAITTALGNRMSGGNGVMKGFDVVGEGGSRCDGSKSSRDQKSGGGELHCWLGWVGYISGSSKYWV